MRKALEEIGEQVSETQLRDLIAEVDVNQNSTIEEEEFLIVSNKYTGSHDPPIYIYVTSNVAHECPEKWRSGSQPGGHDHGKIR